MKSLVRMRFWSIGATGLMAGLSRRVRYGLLLAGLWLSLASQAQTISTVAGTGNPGFSGDEGAASSAQLNYPRGVAVDAGGNLFIADTYNNRIRKVSPAGLISTVAGTGNPGFSGDGGAAISAQLNYPFGVAVDASGNLFIADQYNNRIRKVSPAGLISTVAGNGSADFSGDGGAATSASLFYPTGVAVDAGGNLFIADAYNNRIRKVSPAGLISTVAGTGSGGFSGDGGAASSAQLYGPFGVAVDASGTLFIADQFNQRIRTVSPAGLISTVAGTGSRGFSGDGGVASSAQLYGPFGVAVDASGTLFIADHDNQRIRTVTPNTAPTVATAIPGQTATVGQPFSYTLPASAFTDAQTPNSLTYTASINPANGFTYEATTRVLAGTPLASGVSSVTVVATDPGSLSASTTFTITVSEPPSPIRYVRAGGSGSGNSWTEASGDLQSQINFTGAQQVWVAAGTYKPTTTTDRSISFTMKNGVAIYGGFVGNETLLSGRPAINPIGGQPSSTTLSGDIGTVNDATDNSYNVIITNRLNNTALLDGFLITGGYSTFFDGRAYGGGMQNNTSSPTLTNLSFQANTAYAGGGMYNSDSNPTLTNVSFQANTAEAGGGGMENVNCSPTLTNVSFQGNSASQYGGGMSNNRSRSTLTNVSFQANTAGSGGGIRNFSSYPELTNVSFQANTAGSGGAMSNAERSMPSLTNCVVFGNGGDNTFFSNAGAYGSSVSATYCLFESTVTGYGSDPTNLTTTTSPFASPTTTQLLACSGAINTGNNAVNNSTTDLAGSPRRYNGGIIDMGAYEYQAAPGTVTLTAPGVRTATVGVAFSQNFTASGGTSPYNYSLASGSLPAGLNLATSGVLSGTPTQMGSFTLTVLSRDATGCRAVSAPYLLTVEPATPANQTVCRSSGVVLGATTMGTRYEWYKNGQSAPFKLTEIASIQRGTATSSLTLVSAQTTASYYVKVFQANGSFTFDGPFVVTVNYGCVTPGARQAALDGSVPAEVVEAGLRIVLLPNPLTNGRLRAVINGAEGQPLTVELLDLRGMPLHQQEWETAAPAQAVEWDVSGQPAGTYLLRAVSQQVSGASQRLSLKVIKAD